MLLQQLKLCNIRSYTKEVIDFPEGSTLLSGDVGTGKSTILHSIEFALFGSSRTDLPAEALLRKGSSQGEVELKFRLKDKEISIKRGLKQEKNSIKQTSGYIIINNTKKELMPVELKAEIISLLGYPEEYVSKSNNYIYRYTVYTPQEEMKNILQENNEIRLDVLRKIFNVDKYKTIRENAQAYLKGMRLDIAILNTKTEILGEQKRQLQELITAKEHLEKLITEHLPLLTAVQEKLKRQQEEIQRLEQEQRKFQELKQTHQTSQVLLYEKKEWNRQLKTKMEEVKIEISAINFPEGMTLEQIRIEFNLVEEQKRGILTVKVTLQEKVNQFQHQIKNLQEEINVIKEQVASLAEKEELAEQLAKEISQKEELQQKKKQIEELAGTTSELIVKNKTLFSQSWETKEKIISLDNCPTCLQPVPAKHKEKIMEQENDKIKKAKELLSRLEQKKEEITCQKNSIDRSIEELFSKEKILAQTRLEIKQLQEKKRQQEQKRELLKSYVQENNLIMSKLKKIQTENILGNLEKKYLHLQEIINLLSKKQLLEKNAYGLSRQMESNNRELLKIEQLVTATEEKLEKCKDSSIEIDQNKQRLAKISEEEKEEAITIAQLQTEEKAIRKEEGKIKENLNKLNEDNRRLIRLQEIHHWLEDYFLNLTYTIEKQVMTNIHHHLNQLFQEWFSILIDDQNVYSKIDDSFTPIIEQNGYEIYFNNLSGGEKTSAALAYRLALNKVINDIISEINTKNILILDEPTDGFSSEQLDKIREVLDRLNLQQTIIVSHEPKIESFVDNVIRVGKEGHTSRIMRN